MIIERKNYPIYRRALRVLSREGLEGVRSRITRKLEWRLHRWKGVPIDDFYDADFFAETEAINSKFTGKLADWIVAVFRPSDVFDVGCGDGVLVKALHDRGIGCYAVDGSIAAVRRLPREIFAFTSDLSRSICVNRCFPLVICLEVAEHLPPTAAKAIVTTLVDHAESWILFSAAHPGQGGRGHINEQPPDYWIRKFSEKGFDVAQGVTDEAKRSLDAAGGPEYLQRNLVVLQKCPKS